MDYKDFKVCGEKVNLSEFEKKLIDKHSDKDIRDEEIGEIIEKLCDLHLKLKAQSTHGILIVLQAMDAAGKDEIIKYIFSNLLPQGLKNTSFGKPNEEELDHDFLWRMHRGMPKRGEFAILNRSYYEDVITPKIYGLLEDDPLPNELSMDELCKQRYEQINNFEKYMYQNGFPVIKFFFNMSKDVQKERLLERLENPEKNNEFSFTDIEDRENWDKYQKAFEDMLDNTSTEYAPWYILPADNPWLSRKIATEGLIEILENINPKYPVFEGEDLEKANKAIDDLKNNRV